MSHSTNQLKYYSKIMKFTLSCIVLVLLLGCHNNKNRIKKLDQLFWLEFGWVANDSGDLTSLRVMSYLDLKDNKIARIAKRESIESKLTFKEITLSDSNISHILNLLKNPLHSIYASDPKQKEDPLYCGNTFYLSYNILGKDSNQVLFIPPRAPININQLRIEINSIIESPYGIVVDSFPVDEKFEGIIKNFGYLVEPPKIASEKNLLPKPLDDDK